MFQEETPRGMIPAESDEELERVPRAQLQTLAPVIPADQVRYFSRKYRNHAVSCSSILVTDRQFGGTLGKFL